MGAAASLGADAVAGSVEALGAEYAPAAQRIRERGLGAAPADDEAVLDALGVEGARARVALVALGGAFGYYLCAIVGSLVHAGFCAVIVLFAESPRELERARPALFVELADAWRAREPRLLDEIVGPCCSPYDDDTPESV